MCVATIYVISCDMYDVANIVVPGTLVGCCIRRDNDCDHVNRCNVTYVHSIGKAGYQVWLCLFMSILHRYKGHLENLFFLSTSSSHYQQLLVVVS